MLARSVEVGAYQNSLEAGLAQGLLEEQGIRAEIDGLTAQSWLAGDVPITGFRLMVAREDAERAAQVLAHAQEEAAVGASDLPDEEEEAPTAEAAEAPAVTVRSPAREAVGPMAALLLGMLCSAPLSIGVASVWAVTLLRSPPGRELGARTRFFLILGTCLAVAQVALQLVLGWPREGHWWYGDSLWGWLALDLLLAAAALAGWVSATRRWPSR